VREVLDGAVVRQWCRLTADDAVPGLRAALDGLGDSLVVVGGDGLWHVHVHTAAAGAAIEAGIAAGRPHGIRVAYLPEGRVAPLCSGAPGPGW
jgi:dihydroxyacetone kinase-like predicted kinase